MTSQVPSWSQGTIAGILDLTLRWSIMPTAIVEGLYGSLSGAKSYQYSNYKYWEIPCDSQLSALILSIDGHNYYIDATALVVPNPWGEQCIGSLFSGGYSSGSSVAYDVVLGFQICAYFVPPACACVIAHWDNVVCSVSVLLPRRNRLQQPAVLQDDWGRLTDLGVRWLVRLCERSCALALRYWLH